MAILLLPLPESRHYRYELSHLALYSDFLKVTKMKAIKWFDELHTCVSIVKKQGFPGDLPHAAESLPSVQPLRRNFCAVDFRDQLRGSGNFPAVCLRARICTPLSFYGSHSELSILHCFMQEEDEFIVEGLLNISWGLRRPIRLQMQDDHERIRPPPSSSSWHSGCNLGAQG